MAQLLAIAALIGNPNVIAKALRKVDYYLKSNYKAHVSHKRKRLDKLRPLIA